jgi:YD repeat-containing protein
MDRRQVLVGMTAMGVAGSLNLNDPLRAQSIDPAAPAIPAKYAHAYDSERRELLGPVKRCVEERQGLVKTSEYGPDGKVLRLYVEQEGKPVYSSSDVMYSEARDAQGRMLKYSSRDREGRVEETSYDYDKAGRLLAISNNRNSDRTDFHYQADGSKVSVQTFDPKTIEEIRDAAASAGPSWDAALAGFSVPMGGNVTTIFDKHDNPTEMRVFTADGQLMSQFVREYDASGRLVEEKQLQQNMAFLFLEQMTPEQRASLTPEQIQEFTDSINAMARGKLPVGTSYAYDSQGRLTQMRERNMLLEHTTTIVYSQQGDKVRERQTFKSNSVIPIGPSNSEPQAPEGDYLPRDTVVRYVYQYDSFGNWTEKVETRDDGSKVTTRRTITYY